MDYFVRQKKIAEIRAELLEAKADAEAANVAYAEASYKLQLAAEWEAGAEERIAQLEQELETLDETILHERLALECEALRSEVEQLTLAYGEKPRFAKDLQLSHLRKQLESKEAQLYELELRIFG